LGILLGFFGVSLWYAVKVWSRDVRRRHERRGWTFLGLGIVVTVGLGRGANGAGFLFIPPRHDR